MSPSEGRVMVVEPDATAGGRLARALRQRGWQVRLRRDSAAALDELDGNTDVVLANACAAPLDGIAFCRAARERGGPPVVLSADVEQHALVLKALRAGAVDLVPHPPDPELTSHALARAAEHRRLRHEVRRLRRRAGESRRIVGRSEAVGRLHQLIERVARASSSVLITGESGTGKELVARALHTSSARKDGPFVAVNCAAVPESLLESELFGHVRGAFTDARSDRQGLFSKANGGTLFLDEVGDMTAALQPKLLRVLEERTVRPLGGDREMSVDVRLVAATHQDPELLVEQKRFRADLLYRLDVIRIEVPPLRERDNDVLLLARQFIKESALQLDKPVAELSGDAAALLMGYAWPGNVRELRNAMERAVVLAEGPLVQPEDLPTKVLRRRPVPLRAESALQAPDSPLLPLHEVERRHVLAVLKSLKGNRSKAARVLQVDRKTLYRKLRAWGLPEEA